MELERQLADHLRSSGLTLALAESCTGGLIAARITALAGSSAYFAGAVVAYSNQVKEQVLRVPATLLKQYGAVSEPVARAMADGVRGLIGSDLALAVTGIAGPDGGTEEKPVGTVIIAISDRLGSQVEQFRFAGTRGQVRDQTVEQGLSMLKKRLDALQRS